MMDCSTAMSAVFSTVSRFEIQGAIETFVTYSRRHLNGFIMLGRSLLYFGKIPLEYICQLKVLVCVVGTIGNEIGGDRPVCLTKMICWKNPAVRILASIGALDRKRRIAGANSPTACHNS
jgi:hypothetical protein